MFPAIMSSIALATIFEAIEGWMLIPVVLGVIFMMGRADRALVDKFGNNHPEHAHARANGFDPIRPGDGTEVVGPRAPSVPVDVVTPGRRQG